MNQNQENQQLKVVPWLVLIMGGLLALAGFFVAKPWSDPVAIIGGAVMAAMNFIFLAKIVAKLLDHSYKRKALIGLMIFAKMAGVLGAIWVLFSLLEIHFLAFLAGYMALVPAISLSQLLVRPQVAKQI